jgi:hypothetical protein
MKHLSSRFLFRSLIVCPSSSSLPTACAMLLGYWSTLYRCRTVTTRGHFESSGGCTLCGLRQGMVFGESIESIREWAKGNRINRKFLIGFKKRNIWFGYVWPCLAYLQILGFLWIPQVTQFSKSTKCPFSTMHGAIMVPWRARSFCNSLGSLWYVQSWSGGQGFLPVLG